MEVVLSEEQLQEEDKECWTKAFFFEMSESLFVSILGGPLFLQCMYILFGVNFTFDRISE